MESSLVSPSLLGHQPCPGAAEQASMVFSERHHFQEGSALWFQLCVHSGTAQRVLAMGICQPGKEYQC
jgi:hypothetical protein